jgi:hypothetical protein
VRINAVVGDLATFQPSGCYDAIISNFALHFLDSDALSAVFDMVLAHTLPGGINLLEDFVFGPREHTADTRDGWLPRGKMRDIYVRARWHPVTHSYGRATSLFAAGTKASNLHDTELVVARKPTAVLGNLG